jgi:hypothetical protein
MIESHHDTAHENVTLGQCIDLLNMRRQIVSLQIQDYARPVPACDADYNALLAERAEIIRAIALLTPICNGEARIPHPREDNFFY